MEILEEIVCFNRLSEDNFSDIAVLMLQEVRDVMLGNGMDLRWDETVPAYLVKKGYSTVYGARNLRRLIQKEVEDEVASIVIRSGGKSVGTVILSADENGIRCETKPERN